MAAYEPRPVPDQISPEVKAYLEDELASIAYWINWLIQYVEAQP